MKIPFHEIIDNREIVFSLCYDDGRVRQWAVDRMLKHAERTGKQPFIVPIERDFAEYVRVRCGIEKHRYDRITTAVLAHFPVIYVDMQDGTHRLVDGHHRYLKAHDLGWAELPSYVFEGDEAEQFEVDVPTAAFDLIRKTQDWFSGIA